MADAFPITEPCLTLVGHDGCASECLGSSSAELQRSSFHSGKGCANRVSGYHCHCMSQCVHRLALAVS